MKFKTTKSAIKNGYNRIISVGYCDLQGLLRYENPIAYSTRAEGWACDYYDVDGVCISTGYAPLKEKNTKRDWKMYQEFDKKAQEIISDRTIPYEQQKELVERLLIDFVNACKV